MPLFDRHPCLTIGQSSCSPFWEPWLFPLSVLSGKKCSNFPWDEELSLHLLASVLESPATRLAGTFQTGSEGIVYLKAGNFQIPVQFSLALPLI